LNQIIKNVMSHMVEKCAKSPNRRLTAFVGYLIHWIDDGTVANIGQTLLWK